MVEIQVSDLVKSFSTGENLLDGITFQVHRGERVGLLGKNGAGKTTLFRILTGECDFDSGSVALAPDRRVGLLFQIPVYPAEYTVQDVLNTAFDSIHEIEREMEAVALRMQEDADKKILHQYDSLMKAYEAADGYSTKVLMESLCTEWKISSQMLGQTFGELSGGEKTRINLARLLLERTDILLLDEPTNHLDLHATEWLEAYLLRYKGTILTVSHDRHFLDRVVTRIIELNNGGAAFYSGNYSFYAVEKERRYQEQLARYKKEQAQIAHLEEAAEQLRMFAFKGNDKTYNRAVSMEKRIERLRQTDRPKKDRSLESSFEEQAFRGDIMLSVHKLYKSFDAKDIFQDVNLMLRGGERIGLIGDNGTGKSTLIKIILGEETPDSGRIKIGPSVKIGYLPQAVTFPDNESTLLDAAMEELNCSAQAARNRLAAFHFQEDDVFKPISALSGGERARLRLCMLMNSRVNLLILDEPTNHMDIASREWIENALEGYGGTLLFVSHDRYFIGRFSTGIWELNDGGITVYDGDYRHYLERKAAAAKTDVQNGTVPKPRPCKKKKPDDAEKQMKKALADLEGQIASLEAQHAALQEEMFAAAADYKKYTELNAKEQEISRRIASHYEQWEQLLAEI